MAPVDHRLALVRSLGLPLPGCSQRKPRLRLSYGFPTGSDHRSQHGRAPWTGGDRSGFDSRERPARQHGTISSVNREDGPERSAPVTRVYAERLSKEWLQDHYVARQGSVEEVAARAGVCTQTVYRALRRHEIPLRERQRTGVPYSLGDVLTEPFLRAAYEDKGRSVRDIAEEVGCSEAAVMARLRRYEIPRRGVQPKDRIILARVIDPEVLRKGLAKGRTLRAIADDLNVDRGSVTAYAHRYGLDGYSGPQESD